MDAHAVVAAAGLEEATPSLDARLAQRERRFGSDVVRRRLLATADTFALVCAALLLIGLHQAAQDALVLLAFSPVWIVLAKLLGLYDRDHRTLRCLTVDELPTLLFWALAGTAVMTTVLVPFKPLQLDDVARIEIWAAVLVAGFLARAAARATWRRITPAERVLVVGDGQLAQATLRKIELFPDINSHVVASVTHDADILAHIDEVGDIDRIVVACEDYGVEEMAELPRICKRRGLKLTIVPRARRMFGTAVTLGHIADLPVLEYNTWDVSRSSLMLKRIADVAGASILLALLTPVWLTVSLLLAVTNGFPIFFRQQRAGMNGEPFTMIKFRTMRRDAEALLQQLVPFEELDAPMFKLRDDPRVTRVGRWLRRASIDELPQLWNVLRGDMSLVGPRPEQLDLVALYQPEDRFRLAVKPGLTGPMQVFGRGDLTFEERLAVEREYIENLSVLRDIRILFLTVPVVTTGRGAF